MVPGGQTGQHRVSKGVPRRAAEVLIGSARLQNLCSKMINMPSGCPRRVRKRSLAGQGGSKTSKSMNSKNHQLVCWLPLWIFMKRTCGESRYFRKPRPSYLFLFTSRAGGENLRWMPPRCLPDVPVPSSSPMGRRCPQPNIASNRIF